MNQPRITDYDQAIDFLHGRIDYERMSAPLAPSNFKLDRMRNLLEHLGNPHTKIPVVHVAGTKGKGTTATVVSEILQAAGYKVGLFTSPHLTHFEERVRINGEPISQADLVRLTNRIAEAVWQIDTTDCERRPTFFEVTTALAWLHFSQAPEAETEHQQTGTTRQHPSSPSTPHARQSGTDQANHVDIAVLEVGLGGRLDSTNICSPEVCVITTISKDHTEVLGNKLSLIAAEKAGIIKADIPVVCGVTETESFEVIEEVAEKASAELFQIGREFDYQVVNSSMTSTQFRFRDGSQSSSGELDDLEITIPLAGRHQAHNAACALAAVNQLRKRGWSISDDALIDGCNNIHWPARVEVLNSDPLVVLDAAHNPASIGALLDSLREFLGEKSGGQRGRRTLIYSSTKDKPVKELLRKLLPFFDNAIMTEFRSNPRAMGIDEISQIAQELDLCPAKAIANPVDAWQQAYGEASAGTEHQTDEAKSMSPDLICIAGSFFLASDVRPVLVKQFGRSQ